MAIKVSGTTVIDDSRNITDVENVGDSNTVYYGDGSNLSGVESGISTFVASGAISNGDTVIINTDGTVGIITQTGSDNPSGSGSAVLFSSSNTTYVSAIYDSTNQKVVVAYRDVGNSNYGTAVVGTVSGTSISFGAPVVFDSTNVYYVSAVYDSTNDKVVIAYQDNSNSSYGTAVVGTVSGTSISFGTPTVFESANTQFISLIHDSTNDRILISYVDNGDSNKGTSVVGTVNSNSISFGTPVVFNAGATTGPDTSYIGNGKVLIAYKDSGNSSYGTAIVGTITTGNNTISFGSEFVFESNEVNDVSIAYDSSNDKVVITYRDNGNSQSGTAVVATVTNTSISFGTPVVFNSGTTYDNNTVYDTVNQKIITAYSKSPANVGGVKTGTVSGTSITYGSELEFVSNTTNGNKIVYDSTNDKAVIAYTDNGNSNYGTAKVVTHTSLVTNLTTENYIGIAAEAISNGATGNINIAGGVNSSQTGLTTARTYYVQKDGGISLTPSIPSVVAGSSISSTEIIIR